MSAIFLVRKPGLNGAKMVHCCKNTYLHHESSLNHTDHGSTAPSKRKKRLPASRSAVSYKQCALKKNADHIPAPQSDEGAAQARQSVVRHFNWDTVDLHLEETPTCSCNSSVLSFAFSPAEKKSPEKKHAKIPFSSSICAIPSCGARDRQHDNRYGVTTGEKAPKQPLNQ
eukprot:1140065-Pelagomonas_calceolata.AAC.2